MCLLVLDSGTSPPPDLRQKKPTTTVSQQEGYRGEAIRSERSRSVSQCRDSNRMMYIFTLLPTRLTHNAHMEGDPVNARLNAHAPFPVARIFHFLFFFFIFDFSSIPLA